MKKVKDGDTIIIDGVEYRIGESSALAINTWLEFSEKNPKLDDINIHLYEKNYRDGSLIAASKIKAALEKNNE